MKSGFIFAGLATLCWSTTGIFIDQLTTVYKLTPIEISAWRGVFVTPVLALVLWKHNPKDFILSRREIPYYFLYSLVGIAIFNVVWSSSVQINHAAVATALIYSSPVFVALGARMIFKDKLQTAQIVAIGIDLFGCALVAGISDPTVLFANPGGLLLGLGSGLTFGAYTLFGKGAKRSSLTILFYIFFFATIMLMAAGLIVEGTNILTLNLDPVGWFLLVTLALGPTLGGYACYTLALRDLPAAVASLITTLEPPITALLSLIFLGLAMTPLQYLGTALIVSGVIIMQTPALSNRLRRPNSVEQV